MYLHLEDAGTSDGSWNHTRKYSPISCSILEIGISKRKWSILAISGVQLHKPYIYCLTMFEAFTRFCGEEIILPPTAPLTHTKWYMPVTSQATSMENFRWNTRHISHQGCHVLRVDTSTFASWSCEREVPFKSLLCQNSSSFLFLRYYNHLIN